MQSCVTIQLPMATESESMKTNDSILDNEVISLNLHKISKFKYMGVCGREVSICDVNIQ